MDRGALRGREIIADLGREIRQARIAHGLSQVEVARAAGVSQPRLSVIERGQFGAVPVVTLARLMAIVGLDLSARAYPAGQPLRDAAHLELLDRLRSHLPRRLTWRTEAPLPAQGDPRAWDALIGSPPTTIGVEVETRVRDVQALERRVALKKRDGGTTRVILLVRNSRWNRSVVASNRERLSMGFPIPARVALAALRSGRDPGGDAVVLL